MCFASAPAMRIASLNGIGSDSMTVFASAPAMRIASKRLHILCTSKDLCLSARYADCVSKNAQIMTQYVVHYAVSR